MKNFLKVFILSAGLILCFNAKSFAEDIDVAVYGGYVFSGDFGLADWTGFQGGLKGHYNIPLGTINLGLGLYFQYQKIDYELDFFGLGKLEDSLGRTSVGLDVNILVPMEAFNPYVRLTWAFYDDFDGETENNFKQYGIGIGAEIPVSTVKLFGEFMYENTTADDDFSGLGVNVGVKFDL